GLQLLGRPRRDLGLLRPHLAGLRWFHGALLLRRVHRQVPVVDRRVEGRAEHDMHLVDAVGRERLSFAVLVTAAVVFEVAVVARDPCRGELVEPDTTELRADVVADDLLVPLDRWTPRA